MTSSPAETPAPFTTPDLVALDHPGGAAARDVVDSLAELLSRADRISDAGAFAEAVMRREEMASTALPGGVAIPHARHASVATRSVAVARLAEPVVFHDDKPAVDTVLLIAAPDDDPEAYLQLLAKVAGACVRSSFRASLRAAGSPDEVATAVTTAIGRL